MTAATPAFDGNLAAVRSWIAAQGIASTIHLGDVTADGAADPAQLSHAAGRFADWPGALHVLPGNHDIGDNPGGETRMLASGPRLTRYTSLFGADRWCFTAERWTLIGLDAQLFGRFDALEEDQDRWLDIVLRGTAGPVGLFLHKPLFRDGQADTSRHHRYVPIEARDRLLARLASSDLRFVASGHVHQTRTFHSGGIEHVWVPSTAFVLPDAMQERIGAKETGMMLLTIDDRGHRFARVRPEGLADHDLSDFPDTYPGDAAALRAIALQRRG